jgi:hypothetical protein
MRVVMEEKREKRAGREPYEEGRERERERERRESCLLFFQNIHGWQISTRPSQEPASTRDEATTSHVKSTASSSCMLGGT